VPVVFSILLDQGIDGIPEYPQTAFFNFCVFKTIYSNPPVDVPSVDIHCLSGFNDQQKLLVHGFSYRSVNAVSFY
jgi:hypothetical protein